MATPEESQQSPSFDFRRSALYFLGFCLCGGAIHFGAPTLHHEGLSGDIVLAALIIGCLVTGLRSLGYLLRAIWSWLWIRSGKNYLRPKVALAIAYVITLSLGLVFLYWGIDGLNTGRVMFAFARRGGWILIEENPIAYSLSVLAFIGLGICSLWVVIDGVRKKFKPNA